MKPISPVGLMVFGFFLVLIGIVLPALMVLRLIEPSFALSFLSYSSSIGGLFLGIIGAALYVRSNRGGR